MTPQAPSVSFHLGLLCSSWRGLSLAPSLPSSVPAAVPCHKSHFPFILSIFTAKAQEQTCLPSHPHSLLPGSYVYRPKWIRRKKKRLICLKFLTVDKGLLC